MGLLSSFFNFADPIIDKLDPAHNYVQTWTTGSKDTAGQSPYFEAIAPMIVDYFLPGVGSAISGLDGASTGNWGKAAIGAAGAYAGMGGLGSTAAEGANGGLEATQATQATQAAPALESAAGTSAGTVVDPSVASQASNYGSDYSAAFGPSATDSTSFIQNPAYQSGYSAPSDYSGAFGPTGQSATNTFVTNPSLQAGYQSQGLLSTVSPDTASAASASNAANASRAGNWGQVAGKSGELIMKQQANAQAQAQQEAERKKMMAQQASMQSAASIPETKANVKSFQSFNPYQTNQLWKARNYSRSGLLG